ncbi:pectinesterase inhibitor 10-like [Miscanthus floridulus]|uniref:pectinesterase inhibitor 10-like n=1 Tax=Miscanthus floridulus TaxID=154761 RepID=UPI00345897AB
MGARSPPLAGSASGTSTPTAAATSHGCPCVHLSLPLPLPPSLSSDPAAPCGSLSLSLSLPPSAQIRWPPSLPHPRCTAAPSLSPPSSIPPSPCRSPFPSPSPSSSLPQLRSGGGGLPLSLILAARRAPSHPSSSPLHRLREGAACAAPSPEIRSSAAPSFGGHLLLASPHGRGTRAGLEHAGSRPPPPRLPRGGWPQWDSGWHGL